jgi:Methyltransferase domain
VAWSASTRPRLVDLTGQRGVHLQCHIGTDTLSVARLGARMSGLDFSSAALAHARWVAECTGTDIDFHEADVYDAIEALCPAVFDFVYTGVGALCWLPDVARWARVVANLLRPGGRLFIREGHPCYGRSTRCPTCSSSAISTLRTSSLVFDEPDTYVQTEVVLTHGLSHSWNHGLGEIITAVLDAECGSLRSSSMTSCRGRRFPGTWLWTTPENGGSAQGPNGWLRATRCRPARVSHRPQAVAADARPHMSLVVRVVAVSWPGAGNVTFPPSRPLPRAVSATELQCRP